VVDDYEPWRRFIRLAVLTYDKLQVIGEVTDGLKAVEKARQLQPDLILLDIGLPTLNGLEAAGKIREVSPTSKILFVSENRSPDIAEQALKIGAGGYLVKSDAATELLPAVNAVLDGMRFVSASLAGHDLGERADDQGDCLRRDNVLTPFPAQRRVGHEVQFYANDEGFVDGFARFIEASLKVGNAVIVVATESHHAKLRERLMADGLIVAAEIKQGSYIPLNVEDTLSRFMGNDSIDLVLFRKLASHLIAEAARGAKGEHPRVAACGEGVNTLLASGNLEATIMLERMWDEIGQHYQVDILCGYFRSAFASEGNLSMLERVCAEHTIVHGRELCY